MTHPSDPRCLTKTNKNIYTYKDFTHTFMSALFVIIKTGKIQMPINR